MQQFDVPIIHKTYELYRELHDLQKTIPKVERFTLWVRCEDTTLKILEGLIRVGYLPQETRASKLVTVSAEIDMLRVFLRLSVDIKALTQKKALPLQERLDEIGRMLGNLMQFSSTIHHDFPGITNISTRFFACFSIGVLD